MDAAASYLQVGFFLISVPNLLMIVGMVIVFAVALVAPFPHGSDESGEPGDRRE